MTTSDTISIFLNDKLEHNLTIYFSGETYEYIFNTSIDEIIALACKSLEATVMWEDINVTIDGMSVILYYFDGTSWIAIEEVVSNINGLVSFSGLVMGNYRLDSTEFTLNQSTITHTTDVFIEAIKTVIDIDYISSITGETVVDLSTIDWVIGCQNPTWIILDLSSMNPVFYDGVIINNATGTVVFYNLVDSLEYPWEFIIYDYAEAVSNRNPITTSAFNQINIDAKSLEAEFLWSSDSLPVIGESFELFMQDGTEWISLGTYITNEEGKVILTNVLPIGVYKFNDMAEWSIIANDNVKTVVSTVESLCVKKESFSLGFYRDIESKNFFFFVFELKIMLTFVFPELLAFGFFVFCNTYNLFLYASANSSISLLYGGIKL